MMSFFVKHSSEMEGEETKRTLRDPKRRRRIGPCLAEIAAKVLWRGFFNRYRWPMIGIVGKIVGGRLDNLRRKWLVNRTVATSTARVTER